MIAPPERHAVDLFGWNLRSRVGDRVVTTIYGQGSLCLVSIGGVVKDHANWILQLGRLCVSWGPAGGVEAGRADVPDETVRWEWWHQRGWRAINVMIERKS